MDKKTLYQVDIRDRIEQSFGNEMMIPVYGAIKNSKYDIFIQSYLVPAQDAEKQLEKDTYEINTLRPGFTVYGAWEDSEAVYDRFNSDIGAEPLVIVRDYDGLAESTIEIVEEFRLLFNLYFNNTTNEYKDLVDNIVAVRIKNDGIVEIHKKYLKRYLAVKKMVLILHMDSRCIFHEYNPSLKDDSLEYRSGDNTIYYTLHIGNCNTGCKMENFSVLFGKKIVCGCDIKDSGIWPYDAEKKYIDFIIGLDEDGNEIKYTSDPSKLSNYFGANPDAPHYLTPVFFDSAVLNKYYSNPEVYKIEDGIIRCGTLWSLYIDNQQAEYVSAYLGDLGRDLPSEQEQYYWRGFNKAIAGKLSEVKFKRDFLAQATNSTSIDFVFKNTYVKVNKTFADKMGWKLFLDLDEQDLYNFEGLRIPVNNSISEMDMLVLSLVKVLLDSINEKEIVRQLTGNYEKLVGSISKLEAWMVELGLQGFESHIKFLRNLQELRSSGTGHRKGKGYQKISKVFDIQKGNYKEAFVNILEQANSFLNYINDNINAMKTGEAGGQ